MVESVDTQDLKSCGGNPVRVQVPLLVQLEISVLRLLRTGGLFFFNDGYNDLVCCGGRTWNNDIPAQ